MQAIESGKTNGSKLRQVTRKARPASGREKPAKPKPGKRDAAIHTKEYKDAVRETKQIFKQEHEGRWRILELADGLETKYGEATLEHFAEDTGQCPRTLARHLSVYRAWQGEDAIAYQTRTGKEAAPPESFAVAQELQAHPDRFQLVKDWPDMPTRQARKLSGKRKRKGKRKDRHDWLGNNAQGSYKRLCELSTEIISILQFVDGEIKPDLEEVLREIVGASRGLLPTNRKAGELLIKFADIGEVLTGSAGEDVTPDPKDEPAAKAA
jgi:hypothetical protein